MLSASPNMTAVPLGTAFPAVGDIPAGNTAPVGFTPAQIRGAYGLSSVVFNGSVTGDGTGQTIAIINAYDNPKFVNSTDPNFSTSDLALFDQQFGLPDPPSFIKVDQNGGTSYPTTDPDWANEAALDIEWVHTLAPKANILLVEADSTSLTDLIAAAANYARNQTDVSVVTMSFGAGEQQGETFFDSYLTAPGGHQGITFVASTGDRFKNSVGILPNGGYPAYSPNVVAVGGTSLTVSGNNYGSETGYTNSAGGISVVESKPSYQANVAQSNSFRTIPDVAFNGDVNTGVAVYDSFNGGSSNPWYKTGGTSFSTPAWAAMMTIVNQGRALKNLPTLSGSTETLPRLYQLPSSDFHDITSGNNGFAAAAGYDLVTGRGSPVANTLIPDLVGGGSISGTVFNDTSGNGAQGSGENGIPNVTVYLDVDNSSSPTSADISLQTDSNGDYNFTDLVGGTTWHLRETVPAGFTLTSPSTLPVNVSVTAGQSVSGKDFANQQQASITGKVFEDLASTGTYQAGDAPITGWTVYADIDNSGTNSSGDLPVVTDSSGNFTISGLTVGTTYHLRVDNQTGWTRTSPATLPLDEAITVAGQSLTGANFGFKPNNAPVAANLSQSTTPGVSVTIDELAASSDAGGTLVPSTVTISTPPNHGSATVNSTNGKITYTPINGFSGTDTLLYTVKDSIGATSAPGTITITVHAAADGVLTASDLTATTPSGSPVDVDVITAGHDTSTGASIIFTSTAIVTPPAHGTATLNTGTGKVTYTPTAGYVGPDSFKYTLKDSLDVTSASATVSITVTPITGQPVAVNVSGGTATGGTATVDPIAAGSDSTATLLPNTVTLTSQPTNGTATVDTTTGKISYTPNAGFLGADSLTYTVADSLGVTSSPATATFFVGVSIDNSTAKSVVFTDSGGSVVTVKLAGPGTTTVLFNGNGSSTTAKKVMTVTGTNLSIAGITTTGTSAASALSIVRKGTKDIAVGGITTDGSLAKISGPNVDFFGTLSIAGSLKSLQFATIKNATLDLGNNPTGVSVTTNGAVVDTDLTTTGPITALKVGSWSTTSAANTIKAVSINSITSAGNFQPSLNLSAAAGPKAALGVATIKGVLSAGTWTIAGNTNSITAAAVSTGWTGALTGALKAFTVKGGGLADSLSAGDVGAIKIVGDLNSAAINAKSLKTLNVTGKITGSLVHTTGNIGTIVASSITGTGIEAVPTLLGVDSVTTATAADLGSTTIGSIKVTSKAAGAFGNAAIFARNIGSVSLGQITTDNSGTSEGVVAVSLKSFSGIANGKTVKLTAKQLTDKVTLAATLAAQGVTFGDMKINIVST